MIGVMRVIFICWAPGLIRRRIHRACNPDCVCRGAGHALCCERRGVPQSMHLTTTGGDMARRDTLKALGAGVLAASGALLLPGSATGATRELRYTPEKGAQLRFLRWKRFVQGDEDQWLANTRKFTEQTGVAVQVESVNLEDLAPKAAMSANLGAGPDLVMGSYGQPQLYPDKCLDLTELANYLGNKYGGWYDAVKAYCTTDGHWIALGMGFPTSCVVYRAR